MKRQYEELRESLPTSETLFTWLVDQPDDVRERLLAYCVARAVDGVQSDDRRGSFDQLATVAHLDMREWWSPTSDGYFANLPKSQILAAVGEATPPETVRALALLKKKGDLAKSAEEKLAGTGWLPTLLRSAAA